MTVSSVKGYGIPQGNYINNSAMDIWQRGTNVPFPGAGYHAADRWKMNANSWKQYEDAPANTGILYSLGNTAASVSSWVFQHAIELQQQGQLGIFGLGQWTISFYAKIDAGRSFTSEIYGCDDSTGGGQVAASFTGNFVGTGAWQRYTGTFTPSSVALNSTNKCLRFVIYDLSGTSSSMVRVTGVQFEPGTSATPFSRKTQSIEAELAECQRYYQRISSDTVYQAFGNAIWEGGSSLFLLFVDHPVTMRSAPTIEWAGPLMMYDGGSSYSVTAITTSAFMSKTRSRLNVTAGTGTANRPYELLAANSLAPYIGFSADL